MTDPAELHRRGCEEFGRRVQAIGRDQWQLPTPCEDWNVRELVNHLVVENKWVAPLMEGLTIPEVGDRFAGNVLGDDPKAEWERSVQEATAAFAGKGAMERTVHLSYGDTPARHYALELFSDLLIHSWDLARAIGADEELPADLVEVCYERSKPHEESMKKSGLFGAMVTPPPGGDLQTQLLAVYGRIV